MSNDFNQPEITTLPTFTHNEGETYVQYNRNDNRRVTMSLLHDNSGFKPMLAIATERITRNPNGSPSSEVLLALQEARLLRDFLNRPEVAAILDKE